MSGPYSYSSTGSVKTFTVQTTGEYQITVDGAQGGSDVAGAAGGKGAEAVADLQLTAGEKVKIVVGGKGVDGNGAAGGSGGGGGGGGTFVIETFNGTSNVDTPLAIAGGGGGAYKSAAGYGGVAASTGRSGGGNSGGAGGSGGSGGYYGVQNNYGGGGGAGLSGSGIQNTGKTLQGGGEAGENGPSFSGGLGSQNFGSGGGNGGFGGGGGGGGGSSRYADAFANYGGGGGGGGYSGGGGGSGSGGYGGPGGGGGSFASGTNTFLAGAQNTGDGSVTLENITGETTDITGANPSGIVLTAGTYANPVTVDSGASLYGAGNALYANSSWSVTNHGSLSGNYNGVDLNAGGGLENASDGTIQGGGVGVLASGSSATVDNANSISGGDTGIYLQSGGSVTNETSASVDGARYGIKVAGGAGTIDNAGSISASRYTGVTLRDGGTVTNEAGASIMGQPNYQGIQIGGGSGTVVNAGTISNVAFGAYLSGGGSVTNASTGAIDGEHYGVDIFGGSGTVDNVGAIDGTSYAGILLQNGGNVTNIGSISGNIGVELDAGGTITNESAGTIQAAAYGIKVGGAYGTVTNNGTIVGTSNIGILLQDGGSVTNGGSVSGTYGVKVSGAYGTIDNTGSITGTSYEGVYLTAGGKVTNEADASIYGNSTSTGVKIIGGSASVYNAGSIDNASLGISIAGGSVTNTSTGTIDSGDLGILLNVGDNTVTNAGNITGLGPYGIYATGTSATVENSGMITGYGTAVFLHATTNRLIVDPGAVFKGDVVAAGTTNTMELTATGGTAGVLAGLGSKYTGFQSVTIDAGATWTVSGTMAGIGTTAIDGFTSTDTLDITDLAYAAGDTSTLDQATNLLSIEDASGAVIDTVQFDSAVAGLSFVLSGDGAGGLDVQTGAPAGIVSDIKGVHPDGVVLTAGSYTNPVSVDADASFPGASKAIYAATTWSVTNHGPISATNVGVDLNAGGALDNTSDGSIYGAIAGVELIASGDVDNAGSISSGGSGITLAKDGTITNEAGASIGGYRGIQLIGEDGTVDNAGSITGSQIAIYSNAGVSTITNASAGTIHGAAAGIAFIYGDNTVTNAGFVTGDAVYGIFALGTSATVENSGTITGGVAAVVLDATTNTLIVDPGAVFMGNVVAAGLTNTMELTATGGTAGTLAGLGGKYMGFQSVTIDPGATWTISGTMAGIGTTAFDGFDGSSTLDITDLAYAAGDKATVDPTTYLMTIKDAAGTVLDTIQLDSAAAPNFLVSSDGANGLDVTACYLRGTHILTVGGEVAVEALAIGDVLVTASGVHRPIKWIGTRSYAGRFANANPRALPICFRAGSLGDNVPHRDLWVSPKHAMFLDGVLIPAEHLINGVSVVQADHVEVIDYFHIELDSHDVIVADGALSETFVEDGARGIFHNAQTYAALYPDAEPVEAVYCAPRVEDGFELEAVRTRIAERAGLTVPAVADLGALWGCVELSEGRIAGWAQSEGNPDVPVCLDVLVDGVVVAQVLAGSFRDEALSAGMSNTGSFAVELSAPTSGQISVRRSADRTALPFGQARQPQDLRLVA